MNCISRLISPIFCPPRNSSTSTVVTKFPCIVAVHVIVPVIGFMVIGLVTVPGGSVYPGQGVFAAFNG